MEAQRDEVISPRLLHDLVAEPGGYFCWAGHQRVVTCSTHMAEDAGPEEKLRAQGLVSRASQLYLIWSLQRTETGSLQSR